MVDIGGTELSAEDRDLLAHPLIGSVLLFSRNYRGRAQLAALTESIRALRTPSLLVAVDHEGGRVQRFREQFTRLPPARALGRRFDSERRDGLALARTAGWLMAVELRGVGVDFSFAPCVDLDFGVSEIIGDRAFHREADAVGSLAVAYMTGMREAGMAAVAKHFPGHGAVIADSHVLLPIDRRPFADLEADLRPYRLLLANMLPAVMAAHVVFPQVDSLPASLSHRWLTDILRGQLGFHGCIFADDLTMAGAAAFGDTVARARMAAAAGCDVLPVCNDRKGVHAVLDQWNSAVVNPASQARFVHLRGRGHWSVELATDARWQAAAASLRELDTPPPLVLTEGT
jgi:beta-N-acetylhexosaminidase